MIVLPENLATVDKREYPWNEWLRFDNHPRIIQRGEDFDETAHTIRRQLVTEAARRSFDVTARVVKGERILYQVFPVGATPPALPPMPDQRAKYPWHLWLNGEEHELVKGRDFSSEPDTFKHHCYKQSAKRGLKVSITWPLEDVAVVRAYKPDARS